MIYLYLFGTCFHFIYVFMIIGNIQVKVMGILFRLLILATMFLLTNKLILVFKNHFIWNIIHH